MQWLASTLSLLIAIAGWYYLFQSRAAHKLTGVENAQINSRRIILRRVAGFTLLLLATLFYIGISTIDHPQTPSSFVYIWMGILGLLIVVLILGFIDMQYTLRFYRDRKSRRERPPE